MGQLKSYAGIGSRYISIEEHNIIAELGAFLSKKDFVLYSGNADGSDIAFQESSNNNCVIFLPWPSFNTEKYDINNSRTHICCNSVASTKSVAEFHPNPKSLKSSVIKLMARNYNQIMGHHDYPMVDFVLCCATPTGNKGHVEGGTGQAVRIAISKNIPIINIRTDTWKIDFKRILMGTGIKKYFS